jgi:hypothetical protein
MISPPVAKIVQSRSFGMQQRATDVMIQWPRDDKMASHDDDDLLMAEDYHASTYRS